MSLNVSDYLAACLKSIPASTAGRTVDLVVVDNGSTDGSVDMLRSRFPEICLVEMRENLGFARATNHAARLAGQPMLLLLNPDTLMLPGALDAMVEYLEANPIAGVVAPQLLNSDLSDQGTARSFPTPAAVIFGRRSLLTKLFPSNRWSRRYLTGRDHKGDEPFEIDWVSGACLLVSSTLYSQLGGLDEGFLMYWEDADFCRRVKQAGRSVHCIPSARVIHHEGKSRRGWPARQQWQFHASAYRYSAKHQLTGILAVLRPLAFALLALRAGGLIAGNAALRLKRGRLRLEEAA